LINTTKNKLMNMRSDEVWESIKDNAITKAIRNQIEMISDKQK